MTAHTQVRPTGVERTFGDDEIIVTKTDPRGIITYANDVFLRVSALTENDAIGYPHSLIRHPDMPRAVFKLLWDTLEQRQEMFAYIKNLAVDGAHYWVFAHVTPTVDVTGQVVGYHSNRRRPDPPAVAAAAELYAELRAEEQRHAGARQAVAASLALLDEKLVARGQTYEEFVWELTNKANP
ncbi:PAS domain S-box-containing protein [Krasilnikovia cinnamomea]|uniref:PAS domain S-box-containing protein n=1 Tax=Krasilnikovia cinnamomea TaxID=349313 RepID=A0A4Q7ZI51_9ACTN|nr:PAS domain-containing protein [Krasilnikovia cinnamomea]RZU49875.1 PAS domain S-box-containing protein [Krasilnikovia cinnamomea]